MSKADALNHVRAARGAGAASFIRVPSNDPTLVKPIMELHPAGVIVPRIEIMESSLSGGKSVIFLKTGVEIGRTGKTNFIGHFSHSIFIALQ